MKVRVHPRKLNWFDWLERGGLAVLFLGSLGLAKNWAECLLSASILCPVFSHSVPLPRKFSPWVGAPFIAFGIFFLVFNRGHVPENPLHEVCDSMISIGSGMALLIDPKKKFSAGWKQFISFPEWWPLKRRRKPKPILEPDGGRRLG